MQADNTDSASLHFESILEGDISQNNGVGGGIGDNGTDSSGNHDMAVAGTSTSGSATDGIDHFLFDIQRENYDLPRNNTNPSPLIERSYENTDLDFDIERKKRDFPHRHANYGQTKNELTDNALFNKFRDAADGCTIVSSPSSADASTPNRDDIEDVDDDDEDDDVIDANDDDQLTEGKLKDSNSVSCEDLLEFANKKPKGKERGIESDEVRIMTKVLGTNVSSRYNGTYLFWYFSRGVYIPKVIDAFFYFSCTDNTRTMYHRSRFYRMECSSCNQNYLITKCIETKTKHFI